MYTKCCHNQPLELTQYVTLLQLLKILAQRLYRRVCACMHSVYIVANYVVDHAVDGFTKSCLVRKAVIKRPSLGICSQLGFGKSMAVMCTTVTCIKQIDTQICRMDSGIF